MGLFGYPKIPIILHMSCSVQCYCNNLFTSLMLMLVGYLLNSQSHSHKTVNSFDLFFLGTLNLSTMRTVPSVL